jgi:hypothetical protein
MKKFKDLKEGDIIYYYDHCRLHKQIIKSIQVIEKIEMVESLFEKNGFEYQKIKRLIIKAGKGTVMNLPQYVFQESKINYNNMPRFASKEAADEYMDHIINYRKKRVEKFKKFYERELKIFNKYKRELN